MFATQTLRGAVAIAVALAVIAAGATTVMAAIRAPGSTSVSHVVPRCPAGAHTHYAWTLRTCVANHLNCPRGTHFIRRSGQCVSGAGGSRVTADGGTAPARTVPRCPAGAHTHYNWTLQACVADHLNCPAGTHFLRWPGQCVADRPPRCPRGYHALRTHDGYCAQDPGTQSGRRLS